MSKEEITRMQTDAPQSEKLKQALIDAGNDVEKIVEVGKTNGYDFTKEELQALIDEAKAKKEGELGEDDLDKVAGGAVTVTVSCCNVCVSVV